MTHILVEREHTLGKQAARAKAEQLAARLAGDFGVQSQWRGDTLELNHAGATGRIAVADDKVTVELRLGMLLAAMGGAIRQRVEHSLDKALSA